MFDTQNFCDSLIFKSELVMVCKEGQPDLLYVTYFHQEQTVEVPLVFTLID